MRTTTRLKTEATAMLPSARGQAEPDCLRLRAGAHQRWGYYDYDAPDWRRCVLGTRGHNTIRIDGQHHPVGVVVGDRLFVVLSLAISQDYPVGSNLRAARGPRTLTAPRQRWSWLPVVKDRPVIRHEPEPDDFWSQSHVWGDAPLPAVAGTVHVRFDAGGRTLQRCEAHLVYEVENTSPVKATFTWKESGKVKTATHTYPAGRPGVQVHTFTFEAGLAPTTLWVEYAAE